MIDKNVPRIQATYWQSSRLRENPDFLINEAPLDGLLAIFHCVAERENIGQVKLEFMKTLILGRYTQAQVQSMDRLTEALNKASWSSTLVGCALVFVGIVAAGVTVMSYLK